MRTHILHHRTLLVLVSLLFGVMTSHAPASAGENGKKPLKPQKGLERGLQQESETPTPNAQCPPDMKWSPKLEKCVPVTPEVNDNGSGNIPPGKEPEEEHLAPNDNNNR